MSRYSYETYADMKKDSAQTNTKTLSKVGYFKLSDGEEALVRFNCASLSDFEIVSTHTVKVKDKFRNVSCLRTKAYEPIDNCPLCKEGNQAKTRVYIKLIKYVVDEYGKVTQIVPLVANFPKKYADTIGNLIQEYGDLRDQVFKIKRVGAELNTTYTFMYMNPIKYSEANGFAKDFTDFEGFDLVPHSFIERSKEDINEFLITGEFPLPMKKETKEEVPTHPGVQQEEEELIVPFKETTTSEPMRASSQGATLQNTPTSSSVQVNVNGESTTTSRPRRTYDWSN